MRVLNGRTIFGLIIATFVYFSIEFHVILVVRLGECHEVCRTQVGFVVYVITVQRAPIRFQWPVHRVWQLAAMSHLPDSVQRSLCRSAKISPRTLDRWNRVGIIWRKFSKSSADLRILWQSEKKRMLFESFIVFALWPNVCEYVFFRHLIQSSANMKIVSTNKDLQRLTVVVRHGDKQQKLQVEKLTSDFRKIVEIYSATQQVKHILDAGCTTASLYVQLTIPTFYVE